MPSIFQISRQQPQEDPSKPEEVNPLFSDIKKHRQENIIPPIGIAKPELVESFMQNLGDEEKIKQDIKEAEDYYNETPWQTAKRETLSQGARAMEGWLGGINSFINLFTEYETYADEAATPGKPVTKGHFPTSEELHQKQKKLTGNYLEPKTESGKISQETSSDIGSMFSVPGLGLLGKFALPVGGQLFKQLLKNEGYSEKVQDLGKLGFMNIAAIAGLGNAPAIASQALGQAENMIAQGIRANASPTTRAFNTIRNSNWFRSGTTASKAPAIAELERIEAQIQNGTIDLHMGMQLRRDLNETRKRLGFFNLVNPMSSGDKRQARRYLNMVDDALMESMTQYGNNINPNWLRQYQLGNEAFRITERSRSISNAIENMAKPLKSETAKILYNVAGSQALNKIPSMVLGAVPVVAAAKTIQIMNRMIRSPVLRNHYLDVMRISAQGNAAATMKAIEKFDETAKKLEQKKNQ